MTSEQDGLKELTNLRALLVLRANVIEHGCWVPWKSKPNEYYDIAYKGIRRKSAVWSAIAFLGLILDENDHIPFGIEVCHKCHNKACWNPHHLYIGTKASNTQDRRYDRLADCLEKNHELFRTNTGYLTCKDCKGKINKYRRPYSIKRAS